MRERQLRIETVAKARCPIYVEHMLNILSILFGIVSLVIVIPATIPMLGWANWFALPLIVVGILVGQMSSSNGGRNFCIVVLLIAAIRLSLGGGFI
jgi:hypothetical protein